MRHWAALALVSGLAACSSSPRQSESLPRLVAQSAGDYDNAAQFAAADPALHRKPMPGHPYDWLDRQHASFRWVSAPNIGPHVLYLEWRNDSRAGSVSRQRLWSFRRDDSGRWRMDFYTLLEPQKFGLQGSEAEFRALTLEQLVGYGASCALEHESNADAELFAIPTSCSITTRAGRAMQLQGFIRIERDCLRYREAGILPDGSYAFLVPGVVGLDYEFARGRAKKCSSLSR
jgi:hypothetical protein